MGQIKRFEDIEAWKKARSLTGLIYKFAKETPLAKDFALRDQICKAAIGIMSNIAEDFGRGGNKEFVQFLSVARGSASEVQSQLYVAKDSGSISGKQFDQAIEMAKEVEVIISGFINYLRNSEYRGAKFR